MAITQFESPAKEYKQLPISLDEILIDHPSATFICKADGNDMQAFGVFNNDLIIVDRHITAKQDDIIIANVRGQFICRQLDVRKRLLISGNEKIQPVLIDTIDDFSIEGIVIRSIRLFHTSSLLADN